MEVEVRGVAEVEAVTREATVIDLADPGLGNGWGPLEGKSPWRGRWVRGTSASVDLEMPAGPARTLVLVARPFDGDGRRQSMTVELGGQPVATLPMVRGLRDYAVALPSGAHAGWSTLRLVFDRAWPTGNSREHSLAAWVEALFVVTAPTGD